MSLLLHNRFDGFAGLRAECVGLHDCLFDLDGAVFDAVRRTWRATFLRPLDDPARTVRVRRWLLLTTRYFPIIESTITIEHVRAVTIDDRARIGTYTFTDVDEIASGCRFVFNEELAIDLELERPVAGEFRDERELPGRRGRITSLASIESGLRVEEYTER
jgi:hypothetical protein